MVIVNLTRSDLRDESVMTDDVFALSPISARAVQPGEADYEAIRDAFMETSRGRWFLGEYAKRNRNADTSMVLDAVARIEEVLAAQRQAPSPDGRLAEVLASIRSALERATVTADAALDSASVEANLAPIRKGIVIIKEISWRWREIGADGRICDLIDSQLNAIEAGCGQLASIDPRAALSQAFDLIKESIDQFGETAEAPAPAADEAMASASPEANPATRPEPATADVEAVDAEPMAGEVIDVVQPALREAVAADHAKTAGGAPSAIEREAVSQRNAIAEPSIAAQQDVVADEDVVRQHVPEGDVVATFSDVPDITDVITGPVGPSSASATDIAQEDQAQAEADAHDEAVLERVAAEMSAADTVDIDDFSDAIADDIVVTMRPPEPVAVMPEPAPVPEPVPMPVRPPIVQPFPQVVPPAASVPPAPVAAAVQPSTSVVTSLPPASPVVARVHAPEAGAEPSLGATIIANGLLQPVKPPANDPLAPIRRMSQAEKIAFFS
jgi:hypothetical protein